MDARLDQIIGELDSLNQQRLEYWEATTALENQYSDFKKHHQALEQATQTMKERYEQLLLF